MITEPERGRVFLSYASEDKRWSDAACAVLESKGVRCWVAPRDIPPGTEWGASIIAGLDSCRVLVLIFSDSANRSPQVRREVERAASKELIIVPCRIEDVRPVGALEYALSNMHWLDVFTPPIEQQLQRLAEAVQAVQAVLIAGADAGPTSAAPTRRQGLATAREASQRTTHPRRRLKWWLLSAGVAMALILGLRLAGFPWRIEGSLSESSDGQARDSGASGDKNPGNELPVPEGLDLELWRKDRDRAIAQWAMRIGARVKVNERDEWVYARDGLPKESFRLTHVEFSRTSMTDAGLEYLRGTSIIDLSLEETKVTDDGLVAIADLRLVFLDADGVRGITDVGAERLGRIRSLKWLYLDDTKISDKGLDHFMQLSDLQELHVKRTEVTPRGIERLKNALPQLRDVGY
jgi:hypothetical protein